MKAFFQKNWIHFAAVAVMFIITIIYCKPVTEGYGVKQHDIEQWQGMAHEAVEYRKMYGEEPLWTNSMFGGMPMMQISMIYSGNLINKVSQVFTETIGRPVDIIFMHMLGFYIFAILLGIRPIVGLIGAVAMAFSSYEIIVIQAGHNAKAMATAFLAPVLGAFIRTYKTKLSILILALAGIFMAFEIGCNHVQVTYYFAFLLIGLGFYFFFKAIKEKTIKDFMMKTAGLVVVFILAAVVNSGNLLLTNDYAKHTIRGGNDITINPDGTPASNQSSGLDRDYITHWSYGIGETFTLMSPNVKGGGSFALGGSQFESVLENSDHSSETKNELANYSVYWGDQPFTSGPVYIGAVICMLAFLSLFFWNSKMKWVFLAVSLLSIGLSWGKNFMGLTNLFIDYVPGYSMFRTVTIILIMVELCAVALALFFIEYFISNRELFVREKKKFGIVVAAILLFTLVMRFMGNSIDDFSGASEREQLARVESGYMQQVLSMDPQVLKTNYGVDINNRQQVTEFVGVQVKQVEEKMGLMKDIRQTIYKDSWTRTAAFTFFTGLMLYLFLATSMTPLILTISLLLLTTIDLIPVAYDYLGSQTDVNGDYKYWEENGLIRYPVATNAADREILEMEAAADPKLAGVIAKATQKGNDEAEEYGYTGQARNNVIDASRFTALNYNSSYRIFEQTGAFLSSSRASYFHKSIGGYHGAKLRNFQNVVDFHIAQGNNAVFDMLNVKYIVQQQGQGGDVAARLNPMAAGNAWVVKNVRTYASPNDEILALGTEFSLKNSGNGSLLVNGKEVKDASVFGSEKIQYLIKGMDTLDVPLSNGMKEGMEAVFVMDANGKTDLVMPSVFDSEEGKKSFLRLTDIKVTQTFDVKEEAVMLESEAKKLSSNIYSGEGTIRMTSYLPNKMKYTADLKDKQLVVFSEIYYPEGWKLLVDGKETPILKVNYLLRGAEIPAGQHKLEMVFDLPKFHRLNTIALIGSLVLFGLLVVGIFFRYKKKEKAEIQA
jgi:hypothetical protein